MSIDIRVCVCVIMGLIIMSWSADDDARQSESSLLCATCRECFTSWRRLCVHCQSAHSVSIYLQSNTLTAADNTVCRPMLSYLAWTFVSCSKLFRGVVPVEVMLLSRGGDLGGLGDGPPKTWGGWTAHVSDTPIFREILLSDVRQSTNWRKNVSRRNFLCWNKGFWTRFWSRIGVTYGIYHEILDNIVETEKGQTK